MLMWWLSISKKVLGEVGRGLESRERKKINDGTPTSLMYKQLHLSFPWLLGWAGQWFSRSINTYLCARHLAGHPGNEGKNTVSDVKGSSKSKTVSYLETTGRVGRCTKEGGGPWRLGMTSWRMYHSAQVRKDERAFTKQERGGRRAHMEGLAVQMRTPTCCHYPCICLSLQASLSLEVQQESIYST